MTASWPRCTPSNTPIARNSGPCNLDNSEMDRSVSILSRSAHPRNFWKAEHVIENFFPRRGFDLIHRNRVRHVESAGFRPAQRFQVGAAAEGIADVVHVSADIESFAA